jgi:hypothetical protein
MVKVLVSRRLMIGPVPPHLVRPSILCCLARIVITLIHQIGQGKTDDDLTFELT